MKANMCRTKGKNLLYNFTGMPNFAGQKTQSDAINQMETFLPLISTRCAEELQLLLCSIYVPMCDTRSPNQKLIGPCRPLCQKVQSHCEPVMTRTFGRTWPDWLDCGAFPEKNKPGQMCIDIPENQISLDMPSNALNSLTSNQIFMKEVIDRMSGGQQIPDSLSQFKDFTDLLEHNLEPAKKGINLNCKDLKKSFR